MENLREKLDEILKKEIRVDDKIVEIEKILGRKSGRLPLGYEERNGIQREPFIANCFGYASFISESKMYQKIAIKGQKKFGKEDLRFFASSSFFEYLIEIQAIEKMDPEEPYFEKHLNDYLKKDIKPLILYYKNNKIIHAALLVNNGIPKIFKSAWGNFGAIFEHTIEQVPATYGSISDVKYFRPLSLNNCEEAEILFCDFMLKNFK
jgi:hypothetical protein